jgi:hypothetical protein
LKGTEPHRRFILRTDVVPIPSGASVEITLIKRHSLSEVGIWHLGLAALVAIVVPSEIQAAAQPAPAQERSPLFAIVDAKVFDKSEIQGILGKKVTSGSGQDMGQIVNVIVDHAGQPRAVVIDFGGFLGVGSRKIAVDWSALHFAPEGKTDQVTLDLKPEQLKSAPEYQEGKPVVVIGATGSTAPLSPEP